MQTQSQANQAKQAEIDRIAARLRPVLLKHRVIRAVVYGSVARGETTRHSDLDLIIVLTTDKRFLERYDDLLPEVTRAVPGHDLDLLIYTPEELDQIADRPFIRQALQQGVTIYESGQESARG